MKNCQWFIVGNLVFLFKSAVSGKLSSYQRSSATKKPKSVKSLSKDIPLS